MKLLIATQTVDANDPVLGFFVRWIEEFAKHCEKVTVICLNEGDHSLPNTVEVIKLKKASRIFRMLDLWRICISHRSEYDTVFVHMNQEYIFIAGWLWKLLGNRMYLWRNHYAGSQLTDIAAAFCTKIFCTSKYSYTAKYKKTMLMPVGVDTERFTQDTNIVRMPRSILFLSRMSPSKRPEMLIDALNEIAQSNTDFTATFVGSPLPQYEAYYEGLKKRAFVAVMTGRVVFLPAVVNTDTPDLYRAHEIFVNTSPSGMLDKTLFEASASGCRVLAASEDFAELAGPDTHFDSVSELVELLKAILATSSSSAQQSLAFVEENSLTVLVEKLISVIISK